MGRRIFIAFELSIFKDDRAVVLSILLCPSLKNFQTIVRIVVRVDEDVFNTTDDWIADGIDVYNLRKFKRSSYSTWIHQSPIVKVGDRVAKRDVITNGAAVKDAELALGTNLLVAFMPWHGYNFEDAIVLSKRLVSDDVLTSVHIDEYSVDARDTKLGPEEITRDIPNVSESSMSALDKDGLVRIGTRVKPGDILVGKVTLKGDVQYSPEEKLLRAIFGEKSREVRDTSLRVSPGVEGTVIDVKLFSRSGIRKDKRYREEIAKEVVKMEQEFEMHQQFLGEMIRDKLITLMAGKKAKSSTAKSLLASGKFDKAKLVEKDVDQVGSLRTDDKAINEQISNLYDGFENQLRILAGLKEERTSKLKKGDPLPSGVIKMVKVYIASKRHIKAGDKLAGRHGNKGVISTLLPREDMPYLDDGTPVDIVLNPLGVPSRMNVGQILETMLGWVGYEVGAQAQKMIDDQQDDELKKLLNKYYGNTFVASYEKSYGKEGIVELARKTAQSGMHFATPVFDGAQLDKDIKPLLSGLNLPESGAVKIRDGRTSEYFDQPVTIGSIYMMKLNHMVDDKLHARSVGPYSLVTQQPLGGKAQFGGQRFGEMEVWALEAYGAAYTLQEMLTYKSDDVNGRHRVYESIVRGEDVPEPGIPESFNVLVKELQSLSLQVDLFNSGREEVSE